MLSPGYKNQTGINSRICIQLTGAEPGTLLGVHSAGTARGMSDQHWPAHRAPQQLPEPVGQRGTQQTGTVQNTAASTKLEIGLGLPHPTESKVKLQHVWGSSSGKQGPFGDGPLLDHTYKQHCLGKPETIHSQQPGAQR